MTVPVTLPASATRSVTHTVTTQVAEKAGQMTLVTLVTLVTVFAYRVGPIWLSLFQAGQGTRSRRQ